jgi:hypothetical protein
MSVRVGICRLEVKKQAIAFKMVCRASSELRRQAALRPPRFATHLIRAYSFVVVGALSLLNDLTPFNLRL